MADFRRQPGQDGVIALKAVPGAPASRAELRNFTFGRELSVCIEFVADGRVGVEFGGVDFIRDNGWLFYDKGVEELAGVVNRFAAARDGWNRLGPDRPRRAAERAFEQQTSGI